MSRRGHDVTQRIWADLEAGLYIVETSQRDGLPYGRLVNTNNGRVSSETPVDSLARMADFDWEPYHDDPEPMVKFLRQESGREITPLTARPWPRVNCQAPASKGPRRSSDGAAVRDGERRVTPGRLL